LTLLLAALTLSFLPEGRSSVLIVPLGNPSKRTVQAVIASLRQKYKIEIVVGTRSPMPQSAYYAPRKRWRAEKLLDALVGKPAWRVLGVTDRDISTTAHGVKDWGIMGLAKCPGKPCVVSSFRSKKGVGLVAIHELGHTLGLPHCPIKGCIMRDAEGTGRIATSTGAFCSPCATRIQSWLK
jgi:archaemetzincin